MMAWLSRRPAPRFVLTCLGLIGLVWAIGGCHSPDATAPTPTHIVIAIAEPEYETGTTLPALAQKLWTPQRHYKVSILIGDPSAHDIPALADAIRTADVLVLSVRRQALPRQQLQAVRDHLAAGKPLLAIRTSSHAFALRENSRDQPPDLAGRAQWPQFDAEVIGGNYHGHYPNGKTSTVTAAQDATDHRILSGIDFPFTTNAGVYKNHPLAGSTQPLMVARIEGKAPEPVAWTHRYGKAKVFYTSLGNADDFRQQAYVKLLDQAMQWLCDENTP